MLTPKGKDNLKTTAVGAVLSLRKHMGVPARHASATGEAPMEVGGVNGRKGMGVEVNRQGCRCQGRMVAKGVWLLRACGTQSVWLPREGVGAQ